MKFNLPKVEEDNAIVPQELDKSSNLPLKFDLPKSEETPQTLFGDIQQSKYDVDIPYGEQKDEYRAQRQSVPSKLGAGLVNTAVQGSLDIIKDGAYLLDIPQYKDLINGTEKDFSNFISDAIQKTEDKLKIPVYRTKASEGFDPLSAGWWADNMPSMASTFSMLIPSTLAIKGLKVASKTIGGAKLLEGLGWGVKEGRVLEGLTGAVLSRHMESIGEGMQTFQETYDKVLKETGDEEKAKRTAGEAARNNYELNWAALAQDIPEYLIMFGAFGNAKKLAGLAKEGSSTFSAIGKDALKVAGLEGSEEAYQFITDKESQRKALIDSGVIKDDGNTLGDRLLNYAKDGDMWTAAFFGAIGGAGAEVYAGNKNKTAETKKNNIYESLLKTHANVIMNDADGFAKTQDDAFLSAAIAHYKAGTLDLFKNDIEKLSKAPKQDLVNTTFDSPEFKQKLEERKKDIDFLENVGAQIQNKQGVSDELKGYELSNALAQRLLEKRIGKTNTQINEIYANDVISSGVHSTLIDLKREVAELSALKALNFPETKQRVSILEKRVSSKMQEIIADKDIFPELKTESDIFKAFATSSDQSKQTSLVDKIISRELDLHDLNQVKNNIQKVNTKEGQKELSKKIESIRKADETKTKEENKPEVAKEEVPTGEVIEKVGSGEKFDLLQEEKDNEGNTIYTVKNQKTGEASQVKESEGYIKKGENKTAIKGNREALHSPDLFVQPFEYRADQSDNNYRTVQDILSSPDWKDKIKIQVSKTYSSTNTGRAFITKPGIGIKENTGIDMKIFWNTDKGWVPIFDVSNPTKFIYSANQKEVDFSTMSFEKFKSLFFFGDAATQSEFANYNSLEAFNQFKANWTKLNEFKKQLTVWYEQQKINDPTKWVEVPKDAYDLQLIAPLAVAALGERPTVSTVPNMIVDGDYIVWDNSGIGQFISGKARGVTEAQNGNHPRDAAKNIAPNFKGKLILSSVMNTWIKIVPKQLTSADLTKVEESIKEVIDALSNFGTTVQDKSVYKNLLDKLDYFIAYKEGYNINFNIIEPTADNKGNLKPAVLTLELLKDYDKANSAVIYLNNINTIDDLIKRVNNSQFIQKNKLQISKASFKDNTPVSEFDPKKYESTVKPEIRGKGNVKFDFHPENLIIHKEATPTIESIDEGWEEDQSLDTPPDLDDLLSTLPVQGEQKAEVEDPIAKRKREKKEELERKRKQDDDPFAVYKSDAPNAQMTREEAVNYVKKTLPGSIIVKDIEDLFGRLETNNIPFGAFAANVIYLGENTTPYHEVMHAVLRTLMNDLQIRTLLREIEKETGTPGSNKIAEFRSLSYQYSKLTDEQIKDLILEDRIAQKFERWKEKKEGSSLMQKFFQKIIDFYKWITGKRTNLDRLFNKVDQGGFRGNTIKNNEFSKIGTDSVFKILSPKGSVESRSIINTFVNNLIANRNLSVNDLIKNEIEFNQIDNPVNQEMMQNMTQDEKDNFIDKLLDEQIFYEDPTNQQLIKNEVAKRQKELDHELSEEDIDEWIEDGKPERLFDKDAFAEGGFSSVSKEMRSYIASTSYIGKDALGRTRKISIDANSVYASLDQLLSGTSRDQIIPKLISSAEFKPQTKALVERLLGDTGWNTEQDKRTLKQQMLLNRFYKAFEKERVKWMHVSIGDDGSVSVYNAQTKDINKLIFDKWANTFVASNINKQEFEKDINAFGDKLEGIPTPDWRYNDLTVNQALVKILDNIGIDINEGTVDLSFNSQSALTEVFGSEHKITREELGYLKDRILTDQNPFQGELEGVDTGLVGTLLNWANTDKNFREDYFVPSYMDSEGKRRYSTVLPSYALRKARELREELVNEENINNKKNDSYYSYNTLLQNKKIQEIIDTFENADLAVIGDVRKENETGVTYKHLDRKSFLTVIHNAFLVEETPGYGHYPLGINETKKAFFAVKLPTNKTLFKDNDISDEFLETVYNTIFKQETERLKGAFGKMAVNEYVYLPILNNKGIDLNNKEQVKTKIKEQFATEIKKVEEISKEVSHLLDREALKEYGTYENYIGNFVLNYFLNVTGYNQLQVGDDAIFKNLIDRTKRGAGFAAFFNSLEGTQIKNVYTTDTMYSVDPKIDPKESKKEADDGQVYGSIDYFIKFNSQLGRLTEKQLAVLKKIKSGLDKGHQWEPTKEELALVDLISIKDVTYGPDNNNIMRYDKDSTHILTKLETSYYDKKSKKWLPLPGKEELHAKREFMERHSIDRLIPFSATKLQKPTEFLDHRVFSDDQWDKLSTEDVNAKYLKTIDGKYHGLQVENHTKDNKTIVTGIQLLHLIDTEVNDENRKLADTMNSALSDIHKTAMKQALQQLVNENYDKKSNIGKFLERLRDSIETSTPDIHMDYFLQEVAGDMLGDPNLPHIMVKFEQHFLAHFKPALVTMGAGDKKTIVSPAGYNILFDNTENRVISNEEFIQRKDEKDEKGNPLFNTERFTKRRLSVIFKDNGDIDYVEVVATRRSAALLGASVNEIKDINPKLLEGLGIRIPTQSHHSMIKYKIVEFLPEYYGAVIMAAPEIYYLSGADNDVDSLFTYKHDSYTENDRPVMYGSANTDQEKWNEYKKYQTEKNPDVRKEIARLKNLPDHDWSDQNLKLTLLSLEDPNLINALKNLSYPSSLADYKQQGSPDSIGALNNKMLDAMLSILSLSDVQESLKTPASDTSLDNAANYIYEELRGQEKSKDSFSTISGLVNMWKNISAGSTNIGPAVNGSLVNAILTKHKVSLNEDYSLNFNGKTFNTFDTDKKSTREKADALSTVVSAMTDNGKKPLAFYANLPFVLMGHYTTLLSLGIPIENAATLFINQPLITQIGQALTDMKSAVDPTQDSKFNLIRDLKEKYGEKAPADMNLTDKEMIESILLSQNKDLTPEQKKVIDDVQAKVFHTFLKLDAISQNFMQVSQVLSLSKGYGPSYGALDKIDIALKKLGLDDENPLKEYERKLLTFDFAKVVNENANIRTNIQILKQTQRASKNYSIRQTKFFKDIYTNLQNSLKSVMSADNINDVKQQLQTYLSMKVFVKQLGIDVNKYNDLLKSGTSLVEEMKKLRSQDAKFRTNPLIQFLQGKPTTINVEGRQIANPNNLTGLELLVADSRVKLSVDTIERYIDGYNQLVKSDNKDVADFTKKMIAYLLAKDNLNFKSGSFIKFIAPEKFAQRGNPKSYANLLKALNKELSKEEPSEGVIKELTGKSKAELQSDFTNIFSRYTKNQGKLRNINAPFNKGSDAYDDGEGNKVYVPEVKDKNLIIHLSESVVKPNQLGSNVTFNYKVNDKGFISKIEYPDYFTVVENDFMTGSKSSTLYKKIKSTNTSAEYTTSTVLGNWNQAPYHMTESELEVQKVSKDDQAFSEFNDFDGADFEEFEDPTEDFPEGEDQYNSLDNMLSELPSAPKVEVAPKKKTFATKEESLGLKSEREYTPDNITSLKPNEVFVFGSNTEGRHGKGAALIAKQKFGAIYGQAEGLQGQSYGIITKDLSKGEKSISLDEIHDHIFEFVEFAKENPKLKFYVTKLGSSLAGYTIKEIKEEILSVNKIEGIPDNVILPKEYEVRDNDNVDPITKAFGPRYLEDPLKRALGIYKKEVSSLQKNLILQRLGRYNQEHNTNHSIEFTQVGQADLYTYKINEDWKDNHPNQLKFGVDNFDKDNKSMKEILPILDKGDLTVKKVLDILKDSNNSLLSSFASNLMKNKVANNVRINYISQDDYVKYMNGNYSTYGLYDPISDSIYLVKENSNSNRVLYTIVHEIIHSKSAHEIDNNTEIGKQWKELYDYTFSQLTDNERELYGFTDEHEFIAEMFNPAIVDVLTTLPAREDKVYKNLWQELYATIRNWLRSVFGLDEQQLTLYDQVVAAATQVFEAPNLREDNVSSAKPLEMFDDDLAGFEDFEAGEFDQFGNPTIDADPILQKYIDAWQNRIRELQDLKGPDNKKNSEITKRINFIKSNIDRLIESRTYSTLMAITMKQLSTAETLLNSNDLTAEDLADANNIIESALNLDQDIPESSPVRIRAIKIKTLYNEKNNLLLEKIANEKTNYSMNDLLAPQKDIGAAKKNFLSIEDTNIPMVQVGYAAIEDKKNQINEQVDKFLDEKQDALKDWKKEFFKEFIDNNKLIVRYKSEFFTEEAAILSSMKDQVTIANWFRDNVNYELTDELEKEYKKQLKDKEEAVVNDDGELDEIGERQLRDWEMDNSPYEFLKFIKTGAFDPANKHGYRFLLATPKDKWLNPKYDAIKDNKYYKFFTDKLVEAAKKVPHRAFVDIGSYDKYLNGLIIHLDKTGSLISIKGMKDTAKSLYSVELTDNDVLGINPNLLDASGIEKPKIRARSFESFQSTDPMESLTQFYKHAITYEATIKTAPILWFLNENLKNAKAQKIGKGGEQEMTPKGKLLTVEGGLKNAQEQFLFTIQNEIYNKMNEPHSVGKITKKDIEEYNKKLNEWRDNGEVGDKPTLTKISGTKISDTLVNYTRLKILGLNPFSAIGNILVGLESNFQYAARSKDFTDKDYFWAFKVMGQSLFSFYTGKKVLTKDAQKMALLMNKFKVMDESFEGHENITNKVMELLMIGQTSGEYLVQGQTMLSMLKAKKVTDTSGKQRSLWEAYKVKDGKLVWNKEEFGEKPEWESNEYIVEGKNKSELRDFTTRLKEVRHRIHGNYEDAMKFKSTWYGKVLMIFRTWLPKAVNERFGEQIGDEFKGRYLSYGALKRQAGFKHFIGYMFAGTTLKLPILNMLGGKKFASEYENFLKEKKQLSDLDLENLRVNIRELQLIIGSMIIVMALKGLAGDDDGEDLPTLTYLINQSQRLDQELLFFYSPNQTTQILRDIIPLYKTYTDIQDVLNKGWDLVFDPSSDTYKKGFRKGQSKFMKELFETLPVAKSIQQISSTTNQIYGNTYHQK